MTWHLGLGTWPHVTLAEAREKCAMNRAARRRGELALTGRGRTIPTFAEATAKVIAIHATGWKDGGLPERDWRATLRNYAMPRLGDMQLDRIKTADVMAVLLPIWNEKRVTAKRVRQRVSAVMRWAVAQGYRHRSNIGGLSRDHRRGSPGLLRFGLPPRCPPTGTLLALFMC